MSIFKFLAVLLSAVLVLASLLIFIINKGNKNAPEISCTQPETITVPCAATDRDLLKFVSAYDKEDGDITKDIAVEHKNFFITPGTTIVSFAVSDSDGNVTAISRRLEFSDYTQPEITLLDGLVLPIGSTDSLVKHFKVVDKLDGDISKEIKITSPNFNSHIAGKYTINCKIANSFADSKSIDLSVIVTDNDISGAGINLENYLVVLKGNEKFNARANIKGITNLGKRDFSGHSVSIDDSAVKYGTPGTYDIIYTVSDAGSVVGMSRTIVIIEKED